MSLIDRLLNLALKFLHKKKATRSKKKKKKKKIPFFKPRLSQKFIKVKREDKKKTPLEQEVGMVTHYFSRIKVIVVKMTGARLKAGDKIHLVGKKTNFFQKVDSMQVESVDVREAKKGQLIGLKVRKEPRIGDKVFKVG